MIRKILIRFLTWLLNVEVKTECNNEKAVEPKGEVKFVNPSSTQEAFDKAETITDFINNLRQ